MTGLLNQEALMSINQNCWFPGASSVDLSDADILEAMASIQEYIDITPKDFKEIYQIAFQHAVNRLTRSMTAQQIMTRNVIFAHPDMDIIQIAFRMADAQISGLPVIDDARRVVGVISEKDFLRRMGGAVPDSFMSVIAQCLSNRGCLAIPIRNKTAKEIMTAPAITARANDNISELSRMLKDHHINRLPIVNDDGTIAGIVSRGDIVNSFCAKIL